MNTEQWRYLHDSFHAPYLLIDGALVDELPRLVYSLAGDDSPRCVPLLKAFLGGEDDERLPRLIEAELDSELFNYFADTLEHSPAGCIISSSAPLETLAHHCDSLAVATYAGKTPSFFRFYDPRNLGGIVTVFEDALPTMLGPFDRIIWHYRGQWHHRQQQAPWDGVLQPQGWLQVSEEQIAALDRYKYNEVVDRLAETYGEAVAARGADPQAYVAQQVESANAQGFERLSQLERWLRLALTRGAAFWQQSTAQTVLGSGELTAEQKLAQLEQQLGTAG